MKENTLVKTLFDAQAYWGHQKQFRNPKLKQFIYKTVNKIDIINLAYTALQIEQAKTIIKQYKQEDILLISSMTDMFTNNENFETVNKYKPGMLTNFRFSSLEKMPKLLIVTQASTHSIALHEAKKCGIKTIGLCDTNSLLHNIDHFIVINDDNLLLKKLVIDCLFE